MTKMATMPIYGEKTSNIFSGFAEPIATKLDVQQLRLEYLHVCINYDPVMTLTDFTAGST